jgi:hypothetical protein
MSLHSFTRLTHSPLLIPQMFTLQDELSAWSVTTSELALQTALFPKSASSHDFPCCQYRSNCDPPCPWGPLHSGLSDRHDQCIQLVYGAYIRHDFSHLAIVVTQTDFARHQLLEPIHRRFRQRAPVISRHLLPVRQPFLAHHQHSVISWMPLFP